MSQYNVNTAILRLLDAASIVMAAEESVSPGTTPAPQVIPNEKKEKAITRAQDALADAQKDTASSIKKLSVAHTTIQSLKTILDATPDSNIESINAFLKFYGEINKHLVNLTESYAKISLDLIRLRNPQTSQPNTPPQKT